jgi:hypothetical protein
MSRLIDDIRAAGYFRAPWFVRGDCRKVWSKLAAQLWPIVASRELPVLSIDSETTYYFEGTDQENWNIRTDFPSLHPPYLMFWAEARIPKRIVSKVKGVTDLTTLVPHGRIGFLVTTVDRDDVQGEDIPENARSILWVELFLDYGGGHIDGPHGSIFMALDSGGGVIGAPHMHSLAGPEYAAIMKKYIVWLNPLLLSMSAAQERVKR